MYKYLKVIMASIFMPVVIFQSTYADDSARLEQIKIYVRCEALMNTTAEILSESAEEYEQHALHQEALNSRIVVLEYIRSGDFNKDGLGDLYLKYKTEFEDVFQKNETDPERNQFLDTLDSEIASCQGLNELQKDIIDRVKKK